MHVRPLIRRPRLIAGACLVVAVIGAAALWIADEILTPEGAELRIAQILYEARNGGFVGMDYRRFHELCGASENGVVAHGSYYRMLGPSSLTAPSSWHLQAELRGGVVVSAEMWSD